MRTEGQKQRGGTPRSGQSSGIIPSSFRAISGYLRIVSSGASNVASTVRSAGASVTASIADRGGEGGRDQVHWAGFDKLESEGNITRQVLLLGFQSGFQVWDVEDTDDVHELVSRYDGPVSFLQMQQKPLASVRFEDTFADLRPLLVVVADGSPSRSDNPQEKSSVSCNESVSNFHDLENDIFPTVVRFYSLRSQSYVHALKFRSAVYSVRCSPRVVAICQAAQIHCLDAVTLKREYTIVTSPVVPGNLGSRGIGYGPLAVGSRWLAYSGCLISNTSRVNAQNLTPSASFSGSSNGSLVTNYAKESSKQLAAGIATLGDIGYKKLSRYCSELLPDSHSGNPGLKVNGTFNDQFPDSDNAGMVIVRDIVCKSVITQFKAHKSPISALCFDPSGILLVTASIQGHNINVFRIMPSQPGSSSGSDSCGSYVHLYRLQRGFTNAVIQDISFSDDSNWIMISSSRGTSHLFSVSPSGGSVGLQASDASFGSNDGLGVRTMQAVHQPSSSSSLKPNQQNHYVSGSPVTLSVVSRIKNGNNGWRGTVSGAAAAATGKLTFPSGAIASSFNCKHNDVDADHSSSRKQYHLLVFSPSGCLMQYVLRLPTGSHPVKTIAGVAIPNESDIDSDARLVVDALQKWDICQRPNRRERLDNMDIYGEHGHRDRSKIFPEEISRGSSSYSPDSGAGSKVKISSEERRNFYISEAELQMHQAKSPLWAKYQVYFHLMMMEEIKTEDENALGGEIEIERTPTRVIEARSRDLIPVFDHQQTNRLQQSRVPALGNNQNRSEERKLAEKSSTSIDYTSEGSTTVTEFHTGSEEDGHRSLQMLINSDEGYVDNSSIPNISTPLEYVNNKERIEMETTSSL